jgi:LPXTG-motif cell wall-anchored protein
MAGAFGYEKAGDHYDVAIACGERILLPEVRNAAADELIIADGFSCREQIRQDTDRHALHLAQVLQLALHESPGGAATPHPEADPLLQPDGDRAGQGTRGIALAVAGLLLAGGAAGALAWRKRRT